MPHITLELYPRELTAEAKHDIAEALADVLKKHLGSSDAAISVAIDMIPREEWKEKVYDPRIKAVMDTLVRKPGYEL
jgi:4-oxalocrotonate tautomerase